MREQTPWLNSVEINTKNFRPSFTVIYISNDQNQLHFIYSWKKQTEKYKLKTVAFTYRQHDEQPSWFWTLRPATLALANKQEVNVRWRQQVKFEGIKVN